jgi:predicted dehydrogenase
MIRHLLICGLGSIGRRHLRHFRALGVERIDAYRSGKATLPDEGQPAPDQVYASLDEALAQHPEAVVIANPTALHLETALAAVQAGAHVLVEKPVAHTTRGLEALAQQAAARRRHVFVAYNLRFHPALQAVRDLLRQPSEVGKAVLVRAHFGAFLPDWHPWEDYRASYAARRDLGGGALLTSSHEIDYLLWLLGPAEHATGLTAARRPLGTNVDEASAVILRHADGTLSVVTLSLAQKPSSRSLEIACERGVIFLDLLQGIWTVRHADGQTSEGRVPADFQIDATYRAQDWAFLQALEGATTELATLEEAQASVAIAEQILEADYGPLV